MCCRGNYGTRGRGLNQQIQSPAGSQAPLILVCQICGKYGHSAYKCYKRFDHNSDDLPQALAAMRDQSTPHALNGIQIRECVLQLISPTRNLSSTLLSRIQVRTLLLLAMGIFCL